ncbi:uncharacterized protein PSFLO_03346 [Pseudozyma flocculosa]|uniref:Dolichyl-diphosphooligosaccharide-protein glycosyltransferase subunit OST5 n=1 Tax=Pseudozyma flocculosa TaxID=84751 RepID=A0A5C3F331_9BASI|nr:uncharacterized protein PSFLO_03346 [Pseudozyma flocculosa]
MVQMRSHQELAALHAAAPSFVPSIPVTSLPYIAFILLASAFLSAFYFTTHADSFVPHPSAIVRARARARLDRLPKRSLTPTEVTVALLASLEVGFGVVALFNAVGVYV